MSLSYVNRVTGGASASPGGVVSALDTLLVSLGPITLYGAEYYIPESSRHSGGSFVISYRKPAATNLRAAFFADDTVLGSAEAQINAFLQLSDYRKIVSIHDVTPNTSRRSDPLSLAVIYTDGLLALGNPARSRAIILSADALIPKGATGSAHLVTANGVDLTVAPMQAKNLGMFDWLAGFHAPAHLEPTSDNIFHAFPVGCNVP